MITLNTIIKLAESKCLKDTRFYCFDSAKVSISVINHQVFFDHRGKSNGELIPVTSLPSTELYRIEDENDYDFAEVL